MVYGRYEERTAPDSIAKGEKVKDQSRFHQYWGYWGVGVWETFKKLSMEYEKDWGMAEDLRRTESDKWRPHNSEDHLCQIL